MQLPNSGAVPRCAGSTGSSCSQELEPCCYGMCDFQAALLSCRVVSPSRPFGSATARHEYPVATVATHVLARRPCALRSCINGAGIPVATGGLGRDHSVH